MTLNVQWTCKYSAVTWNNLTFLSRSSLHISPNQQCATVDSCTHYPCGELKTKSIWSVRTHTQREACTLLNKKEVTYDAKNKISTLNYKAPKNKTIYSKEKKNNKNVYLHLYIKMKDYNKLDFFNRETHFCIFF